MQSPKSSFWGNVSYVGKAKRDSSKVAVVIAGLEFYIKDTDPAVGFLRVTSGAKKTFVVLETMNINGLQRVLAVFQHPKADLRLVRSIQESLQEEGSVDELLADWDPDYMYEVPKELR